MKTIILASLIATSIQAHAGCIAGPSSSTHKTLHLVGTGLVSAGVTAATESPTAGFLAGLAVGAVRERYKQNVGGSCEYWSIAYDLAGAGIGSYAAQRWYVAPRRGGAVVGYAVSF